MTQIKTDSQDMISVRLPRSMVAKMDDWAAKMDSSRTSIVRGALATYFRFEQGIFVPLSEENRSALVRIAEARAIPAETLAEGLMKSAIAREVNLVLENFSQKSQSTLSGTGRKRQLETHISIVENKYVN